MKTVKNEIVNEIVIEKSRFITLLVRVNSNEEAVNLIAKTKKQFWDASHNCYAYIIENPLVQKSSDDGEPSGTAGVPILDTLKKNEMTNILAIVTRYFGGIKLGAGGLIRAYSNSISEALLKAKFVKTLDLQIYRITIEYSSFDSINTLLKENYKIINTEYQDKIIITFACEKKDISDLETKLSNILNKNITLNPIDTMKFDVDF